MKTIFSSRCSSGNPSLGRGFPKNIKPMPTVILVAFRKCRDILKARICYSPSFGKRILSEPESGVFAKITDDSVIYQYRDEKSDVFYDQRTGEPLRVASDEIVMVIGLDEGKKPTETEGRVRVRLKDKHGDYNGLIGSIPSRKINWNWEKKAEPEAVPVSYSPAPTVQPASPVQAGSPPVQIARFPGEQIAPPPSAASGSTGIHSSQRAVDSPSSFPASRIGPSGFPTDSSCWMENG